VQLEELDPLEQLDPRTMVIAMTADVQWP